MSRRRRIACGKKKSRYMCKRSCAAQCRMGIVLGLPRGRVYSYVAVTCAIDGRCTLDVMPPAKAMRWAA